MYLPGNCVWKKYVPLALLYFSVFPTQCLEISLCNGYKKKKLTNYRYISLPSLLDHYAGIKKLSTLYICIFYPFYFFLKSILEFLPTELVSITIEVTNSTTP